MTNVTFSASELQHEVKRAVRQASPFVKRFARLGYAAKGLIYILVGALATMAAFGYGGRTDGSRGALHTLLGQPFGRVLVVDASHRHIPKGYIYFAMAFSIGVEMLNLRLRKKGPPVHLHQVYLPPSAAPDHGAGSA